MRKVTFFTCILALLMLTPFQKASAEYTVLNGSKHSVWLIVSTWMESEEDIPAGYRTMGYYEIKPGTFFSIDRGNSDYYYIRMYKSVNGNRKLIKPSNSETRSSYTFWVRPKKRFMVVEKAKGKSLYSPGGLENLVQIGGFYRYQNGGTFNINGENLEAAKLKKTNSELTKKERDLAEINQQLISLNLPVTQLKPARYKVLNGSTKKVSLIVSTWMEATGDMPAGYRTMGYYNIDPGDFFTIGWGSSDDYYIRMHSWVNGNEKLIKPSNSETRSSYTFWVEPKKAFTVVEKNKGEHLYNPDRLGNLTRTGGFYKYPSGGTFSITGDNIELAKKQFQLAEINREFSVRKIELAAIRNRQPREFEPQKVHALLVLLGNDGNIRSSVKHNESHMKNLLKQVSQYADVHLTVMTSEDEVTGKVTTMKLSAGYTTDFETLQQPLIRGSQVNDWLNNLDVGQHDTILIYYNGHGMMQSINDRHILNFDQQTGDKVFRSTLRRLLEQKPGRLKMLITDTCSNRTGTPEFVAKSVNFARVRQRSTSYIKNLFLQHKGTLDITAAEPGHYAWGSTDIGGYFTVALMQSFTTESDTNQDRFLTWEEVFKNTKWKTDELFEQTVFESNDKLMMRKVGQETQKPFGRSFPARVD